MSTLSAPTTSAASSGNVPFTGISQYASTFQSLLNSAVETADVPITELQDQDSTVLSKESALGSLQTTVGDLTSSFSALATLASGQALSATSSNDSVVTATATGATQPASYTINSVTSIAAAASEVSTGNGYANSTTTPVSNGTMTLEVGGQSYALQLTGNNLNSLVSAINGAGAGVTASVVTTSGGADQLSITSNGGSDSIQLYDGTSTTGTDLITSTGSGTETSTGTYANATATQVSTGTMTLVFGSTGTPYTFQLSSNNLESVASGINGLNAGVTASIITTSTGDYLSVSANSTGATTLALYDGTHTSGTDLLTSANQGADAKFQLNGIPVDEPTNTISNVISGLSLDIQGMSSTPTTISLASDPSQLSSALQSFVTSYNAVQTAVEAQEGQSAGPLAGDSVINQLQTMLNQMASYTNLGGGIQSLANLGVEFDGDTGQLSFNQTTFSALSQSQVQDALTFLGSTTSGFGAFYTQLDGFSDPITGLIQSEISGDQQTDSDLQSQISTMQAQVSTMQTNLTAQLETADTQQEELQNQQAELNASLDGLNLVLYGKDTTAF